VASATAQLLPDQGSRYRADACEHLKAAFAARIAGQSQQLGQISNTICRHIRSASRTRPLVIALLGPVGVGKSWTTRVTAQALFSAEPVLPQRCEAGRPPCRALLQIGSYSFVAESRHARFVQLRQTIAEHVRLHPEALIVLEEFDRFDCGLRDMIREVRFCCVLTSACSTVCQLQRCIQAFTNTQGVLRR
jgi:Cdc6-like AAA superfamily ATPase